MRPNQGVIVEVIAPSIPVKDSDVLSRIWGITFVTRDLDSTHAFLRDCTKAPWDAIQPGRKITTLKRDARGVSSLAIAFMSPHVPFDKSLSQDEIENVMRERAKRQAKLKGKL